MEKLLNPVKKILRLDIDNFKMIEANFYHTPYFDFLNQFDSKKLFHASIDHLKNIHKQRLLHLFHLIDRNISSANSFLPPPTRRTLSREINQPFLRHESTLKTNRCETSGGIFSDRGNISRGSQMFGLHTPSPINRNRFHIGGPAAYPPFGVESVWKVERRLSCYSFPRNDI